MNSDQFSMDSHAWVTIKLSDKTLTIQSREVTIRRSMPARPAPASKPVADLRKDLRIKFSKTVWQLSREVVVGEKLKHRLEMSEMDTLVFEARWRCLPYPGLTVQVPD